jgi:hypothetical protein
MPAGASLIDKKDSLIIISKELHGFKNDSLKKIPTADFLYPIPIHYLYAIEQSQFGFFLVESKPKLYTPNIKFRRYNRFYHDELDSTKSFFRKKLKNIEFNDSIFMFRTYKINYYQSKQTKTLVGENTFILR